MAKLYGKLLADLGYLSRGRLVVKNASDFIAQYIGQSLQQTKDILNEARGNVLLIDEAYMLDPKRNGASRGCPFRKEVIDTLVGEVQNRPGEDLCVIMCGYEKEMTDFIRDANPGLARRFPIENAFVFEEFDEEQLGKVLDLKMGEQCLSTTSEGRAAALGVLKLAKQRPNFGNGGEIDNLLSRAMLSFQSRFGATPVDQRFRASKAGLLLPEDFDPDHLRGVDAEEEMDREFSGMIGLEAQMGMFKRLARQANAMKKFKREPQAIMPFTLVLKGPPGCGKTTFAKKLGRIYYNMGILATQDVVEASAQDMIGEFMGQTVHRTRGLLEKGLGKVLFIDEAYRLAGTNSAEGYAAEARDELVHALTKPQFARRMVVVLAGYSAPMDELLKINPGLAGRFPTQLQFEKLSSAACAKLLKKRIEDSNVTAAFEEDDPRIQGFFQEARLLDCWANGRDVETLAAEIVRRSIEVAADQYSHELSIPAANCGSVLEVIEEWGHRNELTISREYHGPLANLGYGLSD